VSNAVLHARTPFEVVVERQNGHLRVVVRDESPEPPRPQSPADDAVGGRGLVLVSKLSSRWGFESCPSGKSVWFELDTTDTT